MDMFQMIHQDHQRVSKTLDDLAKTTKRASKTREERFERLKREIQPHMMAEEEVLYPALMQPRETHELALQAREEHRVARMLLQELDDMDKQDDEWGPKLKVMATLISSHIEAEEGEVLAKTRSALDQEKLQEVSRRFMEAKKGAMAPAGT